jgi:hypothetical protein
MNDKIEFPGLGELARDEDFDDWHRSGPVPLRLLEGKPCRFVVKRYEGDANKEEFHAAVANFLSIDSSVLGAASEHLLRYYEDCIQYWEPDDDGYVAISSAADVWRHVRLGDEPHVTRRHYEEKGVYIVLECGCDWEIEHGLQIVFKNGLYINKVGQYDGHLTNADAFAEPRFENVVYVGSRELSDL